MIFVAILSALVFAVGAIVFWLGIKDGWLARSAKPPRTAPPPTNETPSHVVSASPPRRMTNVATVQVLRFAALRRSMGYRTANDIMEILGARLRESGKYEVGRIGRTTIEFLFAADNSQEAHALLLRARIALEQRLAHDTFEFKPEVAIAANRIDDNMLPDELFDASAALLDGARTAPDRILLVNDRSANALGGTDENFLRDLSMAIRDGTLELHYMPKLRLRDDAIMCAEALCRWPHPARGNVPPDQFIKLAEETGLIGDLTLWALDRVIADQACLRSQGIEIAIDINMSAQLICDRAFCNEVIERIVGAQGQIGIEITESGQIDDAALGIANLEKIVSAGVHVAIDDFGSGLSTLAYLRDLPAHELKIDQMFVRSLTTTHRDPLLVRSAIEIGHALEMEVTAEGVEDEIALTLLRIMRCDTVQGFHISPPLPLQLFAQFMQTRSGRHILSEGPNLLKNRAFP